MTKRNISKFIPKSLFGQLILVVLVIVVLTQVIGALLFNDERHIALRTLGQGETLSRTASIVRVLGETPTNLHDRVLRAATSKSLKFWIADTSAISEDNARFKTNIVATQLRALAEVPNGRAVLVDVREGEPDRFHKKIERVKRLHRGDGVPDDENHRRWKRWHAQTSLLIAIDLGNGQWLNAENQFRSPPKGRFWVVGGILTCMVIVITIISLLLVRRITGPMRKLSHAAEKFGRGEDIEALAESGPYEAQATIRAFNDMRERLKRSLDDRTQMLAATSHDLRTPLTSLRLRAELVDDPDIKSKMLVTLDEMQKMVEAMLTFAREDTAKEETRDVDIRSLVQSIVDDLGDIGHKASFNPATKCVIRARPFALTRAIRNIIENAARHGGGAVASLQENANCISIIVEDNGPGIPEDKLTHVFDPFVRLDEARNQESGSMGLGLGIARTIIRGHGGEIQILNKTSGGLRAEISLPNA